MGGAFILCLLWSLQISEGVPKAGTAIIGSLAEALNLLIFFSCLPVSISLLSLHVRLSSLFLSGHLSACHLSLPLCLSPLGSLSLSLSC